MNQKPPSTGWLFNPDREKMDAISMAERKALGRKPRKDPTPSGYAAPPGTGPEGKQCRDCKHEFRKKLAKKTYIKCDLTRAKWTGGRKTDILARAAACKFFEEKSDG